VRASASSRSAGSWTCRCPPTTNAPPASAPSVPSTTNGSWTGSGDARRQLLRLNGYRRMRKALLRAPTCATGRGWCSSASSSTRTRAGSSAGSSPLTCAPIVLDALRMALDAPPARRRSRGGPPFRRGFGNTRASPSSRFSMTTRCSARSALSATPSTRNGRSFVDSFKTEQRPQPQFHAGSVQLHPVSSLGLGLRQPPASKEARMNNVPRNYN
jgi:hypothetical protein